MYRPNNLTWSLNNTTSIMMTNKISAILITCLASSVLSVEFFTCPDGFIKHEESCYKFHHGHFSWPEALTFCRAFNAHLVTVETASEHNYLKQRAKEVEAPGFNDSFPLGSFWMAVSDAMVQGEWTVVTTGSRMTYVSWGPNQPDNTPTEDCGGLWKEGDFNFGDWPCSTILHVICEIDLTPDEGTLVG